ncbi:hypothetical protein BDY19DRAFT_1022541 [Irpex rosettiformis]|uniref:Uncharacterized protein n=1 Tax=Irpex rosettiformis TaxID=378272 RepID=A0ACB8TSU9_9APHY|nr:hypothetical protein BDY19DRAFT_1022541 [Irpex rosettiformis]
MPVSNGNDLLLDPGNIIVALALQRGDFAHHQSWRTLLDGTEHHVLFKADRRKKPFMQASTPGGWNVNPDNAFNATGFRDVLRKLCIKVGLGGAEKNNTPYCFRRGNATAAMEVVGPDITRVLLNHHANTDTLHLSYDQNARRLNMTAMQFEGRHESVRDLDEDDAPALFRYCPYCSGNVLGTHTLDLYQSSSTSFS